MGGATGEGVEDISLEQVSVKWEGASCVKMVLARLWTHEYCPKYLIY